MSNIKNNDVSRDKLEVNDKKNKGMPFLKSFKLSMKIFKKKKLLTIFIFLLSLLSMAGLIGMSSYISPDFVTPVLKQAYKNDDKTVVIGTDHKEIKDVASILLITKEYKLGEYQGRLSTVQIEALKSKDLYNPVFDTSSFNALPYFGYIGNKIDSYYNYYYTLGNKRPIQYLAMLSDPTSLDKYGLEKDERVKKECRLPIDNTEIAITDYQADMFLHCGLIKEDKSVLKLNDIDDLLGQKIFSRTICGIFKTDESREEFKKQYDIDSMDEKKQKDVKKKIKNGFDQVLEKQYHPFLTAYVYRDTSLLKDPTSDLYTESNSMSIYPLSSSIKKDLKFFKTLRVKKDTDKAVYSVNDVSLYTRYYSSAFDGFKTRIGFKARSYIDPLLFCLLAILFIACGIIAFFLAIKLIYKSHQKMKDEIDQLLSIEVTKKELFCSSFLSLLFIGLISLLLSVLILGIIAAIFNCVISLKAYSIYTISVLILFILMVSFDNLIALIGVHKAYKK